jgi:hypothetical protein
MLFPSSALRSSDSIPPMLNRLHFHVRRFAAATCALVALASANYVRAISLTASHVIGFVQPANPAEPVDETARLQFFIDLNNLGSAVAPDGNSYTPVFGASVPATLPTPATFGTKITTSLPITLSAPYTYLMAKFGPDAVYYYLGGQTGTLDGLFIPAGLGQNGNGLSHVSLFNPTGGGPTVPDGGMTIALLGGAVCSLGILRRRFAR